MTLLVRIGLVVLILALVDALAAAGGARLTDDARLAIAAGLGAVLLASLSESALSLLAARPAARRVAVSASIWAGLCVALVVVYAHRDALRENAAHMLSAFEPSAPVEVGNGEAMIRRDRNGHFIALVRVNEEPIRMLVDTGSSFVAIPFEEAARLGVDVGALRFDRMVITANGPAMVAPIRLAEVRIGPVIVRNVRASVAEPGSLEDALLGMSFLSALEEMTIRGDRLSLKQ